MRTHLMMTAAVGGMLAGGLSTAAAADDLTLCWAAWDPANALIELSKDFEAQSGHNMSFRIRALAKLCGPHAERIELRREAL